MFSGKDFRLWYHIAFGKSDHHLLNYKMTKVVFQRASLVAQMLKNQPAIWETWVQTLGQEDPLEKGRATHPVFCLENPMDRGAWWATVHRDAERWSLSD